MRLSRSSISGRAPDNELYDRGCDLVEAAAAIRRLSADAKSSRAIPAVLGCIEAALQELAASAATFGDTAIERPSPLAERGFANLRIALADAAAASHAARALTARMRSRLERV